MKALTAALRLEAVEWRLVEGEVLALDLRNGEYLALNPAGAVLWSALASGADRPSLVSSLTGRFDVEPEVARADVDAFLAGLDERGLLRWS